MDYDALVQAFADRNQRLSAMRTLTGTSLSATELRTARVAAEAKQALFRGLQDANPVIRYFSAGLVDHLPDEDALIAVVPLLDDSVARVRRIAVHVLGCLACKPDADPTLPSDLIQRVVEMSETDPSPKVRMEAAHTLSCRAGAPADA